LYPISSATILFGLSSFPDVWLVVERERIPGHRYNPFAWCKYFRYMSGAGSKEGNSAEIQIEGTTSAGFKTLLRCLYTDNMEVRG
jgi:hypothetical protein